MARVLLLTNSMGASAEVLPALGLLSHQVRVSPAGASALIDTPDFEVLFLDARRNLPRCKIFNAHHEYHRQPAPIILISTEGGLSAISAEWGATDVILDTAGPAEIDARIRIAVGRKSAEFADAESRSVAVKL
jgi:DNA-binding response OmpR family regulator